MAASGELAARGNCRAPKGRHPRPAEGSRRSEMSGWPPVAGGTALPPPRGSAPQVYRALRHPHDQALLPFAPTLPNRPPYAMHTHLPTRHTRSAAFNSQRRRQHACGPQPPRALTITPSPQAGASGGHRRPRLSFTGAGHEAIRDDNGGRAGCYNGLGRSGDCHSQRGRRAGVF